MDFVILKVGNYLINPMVTKFHNVFAFEIKNNTGNGIKSIKKYFLFIYINHFTSGSPFWDIGHSGGTRVILTK